MVQVRLRTMEAYCCHISKVKSDLFRISISLYNVETNMMRDDGAAAIRFAIRSGRVNVLVVN